MFLIIIQFLKHANLLYFFHYFKFLPLTGLPNQVILYPIAATANETKGESMLKKQYGR